MIYSSFYTASLDVRSVCFIFALNCQILANKLIKLLISQETLELIQTWPANQIAISYFHILFSADTVVNQVVAQPVPGGHPEPLVKNPVALQGTNTMPLVLQMTKQQAGSVVSQPSDSMQSSVGHPIVVYGNYIPTAANAFGRKIVISRQVLF